MQQQVMSGINPRFRRLSQSQGQVAHVLLTRSPLEYPRKGLSARLACVKHAASVRPEPGSNSPLNDQHPGPKTRETRNPTMSSSHGRKSATEQPRKAIPRRGFNTYNALAFNTLLSSQETDTHHRRTFVPRPGWLFFPNLPWDFHPVKLRPSDFPSHSVPAPTESSAHTKVRDASSRWLPGSRPASRRSVPLGACELYGYGEPSSNRTRIFVIPVPAGGKPATSPSVRGYESNPSPSRSSRRSHASRRPSLRSALASDERVSWTIADLTGSGSRSSRSGAAADGTPRCRGPPCPPARQRPRDLRIDHRPTFAHIKVADRRRVVRYTQR
jgi:hypothetical protein